MMNENKKKLIIEIIEKHVGIQDITPEYPTAKLGFTSLKFVKFLIDIEEEFDIEFDDDLLDFAKFETVNDIINYIASLLLS